MTDPNSTVNPQDLDKAIDELQQIEQQNAIEDPDPGIDPEECCMLEDECEMVGAPEAPQQFHPTQEG
jgi:hypothetical protein